MSFAIIVRWAQSLAVCNHYFERTKKLRSLAGTNKKVFSWLLFQIICAQVSSYETNNQIGNQNKFDYICRTSRCWKKSRLYDHKMKQEIVAASNKSFFALIGIELSSSRPKIYGQTFPIHEPKAATFDQCSFIHLLVPMHTNIFSCAHRFWVCRATSISNIHIYFSRRSNIHIYSLFLSADASKYINSTPNSWQIITIWTILDNKKKWNKARVDENSSINSSKHYKTWINPKIWAIHRENGISWRKKSMIHPGPKRSHK